MLLITLVVLLINSLTHNIMHVLYNMEHEFNRIDLNRTEFNLHHSILKEQNSRFDNECKTTALARKHTSNMINSMEIIQYYHYNHIITLCIIFSLNFSIHFKCNCGSIWHKNALILLIILYQEIRFQTEWISTICKI